MLSRQVRIFISVAEAGSFNKAAVNTFQTSASVMKAVNALEVRLDARLFERSAKGVILTEAGHQLYRDVKALEKLADTAMENVSKVAAGEREVLKIGSSLLNPCSAFVAEWEKIKPKDLDLQLRVVPFSDTPEGISEAIEKLGTGIDVIVGTRRSNIWYEKCSFHPLAEYVMGCAVPVQHRLSQKSLLDITDLYGESLVIGRHGDMEKKYDIFHYLECSHPQIHVIPQDSYDIETINFCAETGSCILTAGGWADIHPFMTTRPMSWSYTTQYGLLYSKDPAPKVIDLVEKLASMNETHYERSVAQ